MYQKRGGESLAPGGGGGGPMLDKQERQQHQTMGGKGGIFLHWGLQKPWLHSVTSLHTDTWLLQK